MALFVDTHVRWKVIGRMHAHLPCRISFTNIKKMNYLQHKEAAIALWYTAFSNQRVADTCGARGGAVCGGKAACRAKMMKYTLGG